MKASTIIICLKLLERIVSLWPKQGEASPSELRSLLAHDFDGLDFTNQIAGAVNILQILEPELGIIDIDFVDSTYLHRARFAATDAAVVLRWLKFQCPVCFGTGINNDVTCTLCDGLGWGAGK